MRMQSREGATRYTLMNKDHAVPSFLRNRNEFDEPKFLELAWHASYRPIGCKTPTDFLERRKAPKHRQHIQQLLEYYGCDDLEGFLKVTHTVFLLFQNFRLSQKLLPSALAALL